MRIIAGKYKRTPLKTLEGEAITRPTRDMVKEALFSSIVIFSDTRFLDLFSGSGAIGIEALSLGAAHVDFLEKHPKAIRTIQKNLMSLQLSDRAALVRVPDGDYGIIFADPPYDNPNTN